MTRRFSRPGRPVMIESHDADISFGQWLKRRRRVRDLTQAALARQVPCAVQTIRALEADTLRPSRELATRLAQALGLSLDDPDAFLAFARGQSDAAPPLVTAPAHPQA